MYRPGDVVDVILRDLPQMPGWTLPATALIIAADRPELLLYVHDRDVNGAGMYAIGPLSSRLDGHVIKRPISDGPQPGRIDLGRITDHGDVPDSIVEQARAALASHIATRASSPLDATQLDLLDVAQATIAERRTAVTEAEQQRDRIVRRFLAGNVAPVDISRPGLSTSRISQIKAAASAAA
jgi:hypothetical protein